MDDSKIVELFFSRSEQAIAETRAKYGALCMKVARGVLNSAEDCEECVSTSYFKLWNAIPPKRPESLCGYLCRIVRNTALSAYEKADRRSRAEILTELDETLPFGKTVESEFDARQLSELLNLFLKKTNRKSRDIFVAHYYFNMTAKEIAGAMGMSEAAVLSRLMRTRLKLREFLIERGEEL